MLTDQQTLSQYVYINTTPAVVRQYCRCVLAALEGQSGLWVLLGCTMQWGEVGEDWGTQRYRPEAPGPSASGGAAGSR